MHNEDFFIRGIGSVSFASEIRGKPSICYCNNKTTLGSANISFIAVQVVRASASGAVD